VADKLQQANDTLQTVTVMKDNATAIVQVAKPFLGIAPTSWQLVAAVADHDRYVLHRLRPLRALAQDSHGGPVMQALLLKLAIQYGVYALLALGVVGGVAGYGVYKYNSGWNAAIAGIAPQYTRPSMRFAALFRRLMIVVLTGGFWDAVSGVCR
jgi:hypothetical protein